MDSTAKSRSSIAWRLIVVVAVIFVLHVAVTQEVKVHPSEEKSKMDLPPLLGNMAGVNLAFPRTKYGYPSVHYEGHAEHYRFGPRGNSGEFTPTQDTPIRGFAIEVRMSNFKPVKTEQDLIEYMSRPRLYGDKNLPPDRHRWLEVIFSPALYQEGNGNLKPIFEKHLNEMDALIGPFTQQPDAFGLKQRASKQEGGALFFKFSKTVYDTFLYDNSNIDRFIECNKSTGSKSGCEISCLYYFVIHELKSVAVATTIYSEADLSRWQEIEAEIKKLVLSYIVKSDTQR